jgi:hypothetical protein
MSSLYMYRDCRAGGEVREEEEGHMYLGHELFRFGCKGGGGREQGVQLRGFPCKNSTYRRRSSKC